MNTQHTEESLRALLSNGNPLLIAPVLRAVNAHEELLARLNGLIATLESVRANYDKPEKALNGSWYAFDHMVSDEVSKTRQAIAKAERGRP